MLEVMLAIHGPNRELETGCGLYIHVPYCQTKCGYCDFFSVPLADRNPGPLVDAIRKELRARLAGCPCPIRTIFIGGGTPTVLPLELLDALLREVRVGVDVAGIDEFTVEANPATVDEAKAALLVSRGVTRVSLGAQSFREDELQVLERLHRPTDVASSVQVLRQAGVAELNLDLIFGIPGQSLGRWQESLQRAIDLGVEHLACYALTYEPNTRLTAQRDAGQVVPCDEELEADMYLCAIDQLVAAGFGQYEISNFARPGRQCEHNLIYWRNQPYVGVGPSAVGCVDGRRHKNVAGVAAYVRGMRERGHAEADGEQLDATMLATEMVMMQLRLVEGLSLAAFHIRTGFDGLELFEGVVERFTSLGLLSVTDDRLALTRDGRLVANAVMADLASCIPSAAAAASL